MLDLPAPEVTALVGGLRVLGNNVGDEGYGVFTDRPGRLTNDFFVNLIDMTTAWSSVDDTEDVFEGRDRDTGDLMIEAFVRGWVKVMDNDRFDLDRASRGPASAAALATAGSGS